MNGGDMRIHEKPIHGRFFSGSALPSVLGLVLIAAIGAGDGVAAELSEEQFLTPFDDAHPLVIGLSEDLARAEAERRRAGTLENPYLEFEHEAPLDEAHQTTLKLGWRPPLDGRRGMAIDASDAQVEAERHDLDWARLRVRQDLRAVFADWAVADMRRQLVLRHFESLKELEQRLRVRAERGEESRLAARRFTLAVARVEVELANSEAELARMEAQARSVHTELAASSQPMLPALPPAPAALADSVRPDLLARRSELDAATHRRKLAGRSFEFPTLVVGWTRLSTTSQDFDGPYLGLTWDAPIFDRNQGDRDESTRAIAIAEARVRLTEWDARQRRIAALEVYQTLHSRSTEVRNAVSGSSEIVDAASASFLAGESSMTDLLDTLGSALDGQLAALELHARALEAHRELEMSAGYAMTGGESR